MKEIEILCIGHCCHDVTDDGFILGGSVSYASLISKALGSIPAVLTSVGDDFLFRNSFEDNHISFYNIEAEHTTVFENQYLGSKRIQHIHSRASDISRDDVPQELCETPIVLLGSIAKEIDYNITDKFKNSIIGAIIQGSMRSWDEKGKIYSQVMDWAELNGTDIVFISDDDMKGLETEIPKIVEEVGHVVLTHGKNGATVFYDEKEIYYPSFPTNEKDATGAGDTFSTAYLLAYCKTKNVRYSAIYAHCAASIMVEGIGLQNSPLLYDVHERVEEYFKLFPDY